MTTLSKLKKKIESLWSPNLDMQIHANYYQKAHAERWWIALNGEIVWDFPAPFVGYNRLTPMGARLPMIQHFGSFECQIIKNIVVPFMTTPVDELLIAKFDHDEWELGDILRAADRRLGKKRLREWAVTLDPGNPAIKIMNARFPWKEKSNGPGQGG